jgi:A/G-specific adenine glycosylase
MTIKAFQQEIKKYYRVHGRHDMLWRHGRTPYRVFVSEVMLQQTQVSRVTERYPSFIRRFPDFYALANASPREVLKEWQGMGYNRRALNLQRAAKIVIRERGGKLPRTPEELEALPGIGKATAGSIAAFAWNRRAPFIETNIRRVFIHFFFPRKKKVRDEELLALVRESVPRKDARAWFYALMDYGTMLAAREKKNPNARSVEYRPQPKFAGSRRELRGKILAHMLSGKRGASVSLARRFGRDEGEVKQALEALVREGFLVRTGKTGFWAAS